MGKLKQMFAEKRSVSESLHNIIICTVSEIGTILRSEFELKLTGDGRTE